MIFDLHPAYDYALLALRIIVAIVFLSSGWKHVKNPKKRSESIGLPVWATALVGATEIIGAISVACGIYIQVGAAMLMLVMLGAIYKKAFVWKTGFYSEKGTGWHYDLIFLIANFLFLTIAGSLIIIG